MKAQQYLPLYTLLLLLLPAYFCSATALAVPLRGEAKKGPERLAPQVAAAPIGAQETVAGPEIATSNYLITLSRAVTNLDKDTLFDFLMRQGAIVKQVYDYRVYKGVLFSIPTSADAGLKSWQTTLAALDGVKFVEEDQVIKTN